MTVQEQQFAFMYARSDRTREAGRYVWGVVFGARDGKKMGKSTIGRRVSELLSRDDVQFEIDSQTAAMGREREMAEKAVHTLGLDMAKAMMRLREKTIIAALAVAEDVIHTLSTGHRVTSAQAKMLELNYKACGLVGPETLVQVQRPVVEDVRELMAEMEREAANLGVVGFALPHNVLPGEEPDA